MGIRYFWLGALVFLASAGLWLRSSLFGFDSYATLAAVRFGWFDNFAWQPFANVVWAILPDSLLIFNLIMFLSLFFCVLGVWKLVCYFYDERKAWISVFLLLGLSPVLLFGFGEFENEVLAYPLIVWSIYWFLTSKSIKTTIQSIVTMLFSFGFWGWPYYLTFFNFGVSKGAVEQNRFAGVINFWFLLPFLFFIPLLSGNLKWFGLLAMFGWMWNAKLFILLLPFVALAISEFFHRVELTETSNIYVCFLEKHLNYVFIIAFFCLIGWNIAFVLQLPNQNDWIAVETAVKLSEDNNLPLYNDWSYGYWFWSKGIKTRNNPGDQFDLNYVGKGVYLTEKDLNCLLVYEKKEIARKKTNIWQCN